MYKVHTTICDLEGRWLSRILNLMMQEFMFLPTDKFV